MTADEAILHARTAAGLTQEALTERLGLKRSCMISSWENNRRHATPESVFRVFAACGVKGALFADGWRVQRKRSA